MSIGTFIQTYLFVVNLYGAVNIVRVASNGWMSGDGWIEKDLE